MRTQCMFLGILMLMLSCKKMDHYEISGKLQNIPDSTILILSKVTYNVGTMVQIDTIINGQFYFTGILDTGTTEMTLMTKDMQHYSGYVKFWVDNCKIRVTGSNNYLATWNVKSKLPEQKILNLFQKATKDKIKTRDSLWIEMLNSKDRTLQSLIKKKRDSISNEVFLIELNLLKKHFNSLTAVEELYRMAKFSSVDKKEIGDILNKMDDKYKNTVFGKGIQAEINKPIPPSIGDKMPESDLHDIEGKMFRLSDFLGKYMLLDFWSLACYPCVLAAPELRELKYSFNDSLTIVGLSMDIDPKMWIEATKRDSVTWINLSDGMGNFAGVSSKFGIEDLPTYFLINPAGTIIDKWIGYENGIIKEKILSHMTIKNK